jgi:uncharacterized protein (DUF2141 family)
MKRSQPPRREPGKRFAAGLLALVAPIVVLAAGAVAQNSLSPPKPAAIEGIVIKDPGSEPVKKALIELIGETQPGGQAYTAVTTADGLFHIAGINPGRYRLFAERPGYLEVAKHHARTEGRVLNLAAGQELMDLQIRLQSAAVVRGRVTDEDGDPMFNAQTSVLRQTYASGHSRWEQVGSERTNDLGEYRISSLPAGSYYVSVSPPPDFKSLIEAAAATAETRTEGAPEKPGTNQKAPTPAASYQTTFYPGTTDRSQAAPIQLHAGDDFPVNFSLTPSPSLSIRGAVVNLPPRSSAVIMLQSRDFNLLLNGAEMHKDGSFVIHDVAPGSYTILATVENASPPMMARQSLLVAGNSVEGLRLVPQPGGSIRGRFRLESRGTLTRLDPNQIFLSLQSTDNEDDTSAFTLGEGFSNLAHVAPDGSFEWNGIPPGEYSVRLVTDADANADWYLKSTVVAGRDVSDSGISINGGTLALDLVASARGAVAEGVAADRKGDPVANAVIVAVPEPRLRSRLDRYRKTVSDQSGRFNLRGLPPGDYTVFAWESVDGEAYYNPNFLKIYEAQGTALRVSEGDRKALQLEAIPEVEDQP